MNYWFSRVQCGSARVHVIPGRDDSQVTWRGAGGGAGVTRSILIGPFQSHQQADSPPGGQMAVGAGGQVPPSPVEL